MRPKCQTKPHSGAQKADKTENLNDEEDSESESPCSFVPRESIEVISCCITPESSSCHLECSPVADSVEVEAAGSGQPNVDPLEEKQHEVSEANEQICDEMSENLPVRDGEESESVEVDLAECRADNTVIVSGEVGCDTSEFVNGSPETLDNVVVNPVEELRVVQDEEDNPTPEMIPEDGSSEGMPEDENPRCEGVRCSARQIKPPKKFHYPHLGNPLISVVQSLLQGLSTAFAQSEENSDLFWNKCVMVPGDRQMLNESCGITEEELKELQEIISHQDIQTAKNTIKEYLKQQDRVELNIGVTGESGSGKSTFVNAFRGLGDEDEGSAKIDVVETTIKPEVYPHPNYDNVKVWDLPGIGTQNFKADEYSKLVQFERYDFFIIIAADRFRECHTQLVEEIKKMGKKFYFVRSQIDNSIRAEKRKKIFDEKKTLDKIREDCENGLRKIGIDDPVMFLISGWELNKYDINLLQERMEKDLPQHKKHVLMLALPNITLKINEKKKEVLEKNIKRVAFLSACVAAVPIPCLSLTVDLAIIAFEIDRYCKAFGLDRKSLQQLCERSGKTLETLESLLESVWHKGICTSSLSVLLNESTLLVTEEAVESVLRVVPVLGSVGAGALSFWTLSRMLKNALNDIAEDARNVLMAVLDTEV
ncbi:interferon-inducible GTPase 5-like [Sinocyclocheilus anshuiensis]|uniref:interferon-inducible GTPase 5-like n=1 Tax=Sinocyclocheilus anshuiensis TaxID=1608454 RepID=UPI0007BA57F8|nr:PREDICTED: interferon-inducible GTPase 5-like [Sinocyclocheilus anshuiensis]